jgi:hypothetical protein
MSEEAINKEITWSSRLEQYFTDIAEKCQAFAWLHRKSEGLFSHRTIFLDMPTIIIGAINGFVSVGSKQIFKEDEYASVYIGMVALFVSLLNTIQSYFGWSRRAESHKISSNSYGKLFRFVSLEMSLPRDERLGPSELLKYVKQEFDRLAEISPQIPPRIVDEFNKKFSDVKDFTRPEEINGIHAVEAYEKNSNTQEFFLRAPPSTPNFSRYNKPPNTDPPKMYADEETPVAPKPSNVRVGDTITLEIPNK